MQVREGKEVRGDAEPDKLKDIDVASLSQVCPIHHPKTAVPPPHSCVEVPFHENRCPIHRPKTGQRSLLVIQQDYPYMNPSLLRSKRLRMSSEAASVRPLPPLRSLSLFRDAAAGRPKATLQTTTTHTHNDVGRQGGDDGPSLETPPSYLSYKIKFTRVVSGVRMENTDQPTNAEPATNNSSELPESPRGVRGPSANHHCNRGGRHRNSIPTPNSSMGE